VITYRQALIVVHDPGRQELVPGTGETVQTNGDGAAAWNEMSWCGLLFRKLNRGVARLVPSRGRADHEVCGVLNRAGFAGGHLV